jgi:hypothetical protein
MVIASGVPKVLAVLRLSDSVPEHKKDPEQKSPVFMRLVPLFRMFRHF